jgi:glycerate-2-kinase
VSGGGSALFEKPLLPLAELQDVTNQLLAAGADIVEINTIRKRLSAVKGGRFARHCAPAQVFAVVLSDILGDPLDMIASGPAYPDSSSCAQALDIAKGTACACRSGRGRFWHRRRRRRSKMSKRRSPAACASSARRPPRRAKRSATSR